jgi:cyclic pyranopterin phosphate synthase
MVDVGAKPISERVAVAAGRVVMAPATLASIQAGNLKKGDVLSVARLAGIMAAKRTAELIPLCHPLALTYIEVELTLDPAAACIHIRATCKTSGQTGVEMEALTAVSVAALTIYDMAKAIDREMQISDIRLLEKRGGQHGDYYRHDAL